MYSKFKKIFAFLLCIVLNINIIGVLVYADEYSQDDGYMFDGYSDVSLDPDFVANATWYFDKAGTNASKAIAKSVDLSYSLPEPGNQLSTNSCVGWAFSYCMSSVQSIRRNWNPKSQIHQFSPSFIQRSVRSNDSYGASVMDAAESLENNGVCLWNYRPFSVSSLYDSITSLQREAASFYKATTYYVAFGVNEIKRVLNDGYAVVIGVNAYSDFQHLNSSNMIYDSYTQEDFDVYKTPGHAICLVGYDDSKQAFKFINSWGTSWGLNGYGWIAYKMLNDGNIVDLQQHGAAVGFTVMTPNVDDYIIGDVNEDGKVTASDARLVLRYQAKLEAYTDRQFVLGDVDGDGKLTATDAQTLLKYSSNQIAKLPLYE